MKKSNHNRKKKDQVLQVGHVAVNPTESTKLVPIQTRISCERKQLAKDKMRHDRSRGIKVTFVSLMNDALDAYLKNGEVK